ncbi:flagellar biosynthesis protein FlhF [Billgrantia endophytica]|uniref:Flagellar biosynthesis protein FlhF n=1 Tax=Billgrantia endophytica TaxID=2033802 RepID=A0A2N7U115_9GAMM|nr:flagellar biosynthesis protein FlhF [Halomonas endophytica]PMR74127.1 flagellar biosynthesis protein FlhF [Halomonas endophytica]
MSIKRFVGANSRDAMRQVRETLGDEALILANRRVDDGVEILAMAESATPDRSSTATISPPTVPAFSPPPSGRGAASAFEAMSEKLLEEMRDMRALLSREQVQRDSRREPAGGLREQLQEVLLDAGFGQELAKEVVSALPEELAGPGAVDDRAMSWLQRQLSKRLAGLDDEAAFMERTGIVALIGPTGIGKTTTTAKLAARYVMRHGTRPVALVTTDSFRIGAHEQLRIYSRLLDVPMYALNADQPVTDLLERMQGKSWVIIDTVGMSQRDHRVIEQVAHLRGGASPVRLVLLLNAASQPETLEEVVIRYRQAARAAGGELLDCIITKQDEAGRLAPVLDIIMRHGLRLLFVSHGQRVPEDMSVADRTALIGQALESRVPRGEPASRTMAVETPSRSPNLLGQGRRLATTLQALRQRLAGFEQLEAVWDLLGLPETVQQHRLDAMLSAYPANGQALGMQWSVRSRVKGECWSMPDIALASDGTWLALPLLQHRQVAGHQARLEAALRQLSVNVHLLTGLPDGEACRWLEQQELTWCSQVRGSQRVEHANERQVMSALAPIAESLGDVTCRFRGTPARLALATLPVLLAVRGGKGDSDALAVQAWFGEVRDMESGRALAKRYWVAPARLGQDAMALFLSQLQSDGLPQLTRRAWQRLDPRELGDVRPDVRLLMASGLATVAAHLDLADDESAMDLRAELLGLTGGRRRRRDVALLEALARLFMVRDAIRHLGLGEREKG